MKLIITSVLVMVAIVAYAVPKAMDSWNVESAKWDSENACIASLVSEGVERSDIIRNDGLCTIKDKS